MVGGALRLHPRSNIAHDVVRPPASNEFGDVDEVAILVEFDDVDEEGEELLALPGDVEKHVLLEHPGLAQVQNGPVRDVCDRQHADERAVHGIESFSGRRY